jgi:hypothetical protein
VASRLRSAFDHVPRYEPHGHAGVGVAEMSDRRFPIPRRFLLIATGLLVIMMPAFTLVAAFAVLSVAQSVVLDQLTLVEIAELYLIEVMTLALFSYLLYRLTMYAVRNQPGENIRSESK